MKKLDEPQKSILSLYMRSERDGEGWAIVSKLLWPWIEKAASPDMFEICDHRIRATEAGKVIIKFVL